jgi:WD40 repeat protein/serine/threonine protein kinase
MANLAGTTIKGYELHDLIGEGGFGAVYRATQTVVGREVVIKVILPQYANQPEFVRRFEAEAQLVARLEHLHIVPLYDYWRDPEGAFLVMRYLRGGTLRTLLREEPLTMRAANKVLTQIGAALTVAHRNGVVHRDIKPSNILLDSEHNAYLSDFGIAIETAGKSPSPQGAVTGSAGYISPEQINMQPVSPRTDVYSMGVMMWEALMGRHPYSDARTPVALFIKHMNEPLPPLAGFPDAITAVMQKASAKDPQQRYADMVEMVSAFRMVAADVNVINVRGSGVAIEDFDSTIMDVTNSQTNAAAANPYKGLRAFQESDASDFHGREMLIETLLKRMGEDHELKRFLAIVGPSGGGKSSVVKAGILPALRRGRMPNSDKWFIVEMVPSNEPLRKLEEALLRVATAPIPNLYQQLQASPAALNTIVKQMLPTNSELVLVVDQFEEAFTLGDEAERNRFLENIHYAIVAKDSALRVLVTLRADFYDRPLMVQNFSALMQQRTEVVVPLTADELERAITAPARRMKVFFQQGLAAQIVSEVNEQPGVLPMLQYALTELFERRENNLLTTKAYQEIGGVLGALARRADEIYTQLTPEQQEATRQLFLRLVTLGEGNEDTRRRALQQELLSAAANRVTMQDVIDKFGNYRLLTFDRDPATRSQTVEVAHEALIREWKRLRTWLDESRSDIRLQRLLLAAANEWEDSKRDPSFLLRGGRLVQFEEWYATTTLAMAERERDYLIASSEQHKLEEEAERIRAEKERERDKRERQRTRTFLVGAVIGLIVLFIAFGFAVLNFFQAQADSERALAAALTATIAQGDAQIQAQVALDNAATATIAQGDAQIQAQAALNSAATATIAQGEARREADNAQTQVAIAAIERANADTQRANAELQAQRSLGLALAASADQVSDTSLPLGLALALEANVVSGNQSAEVQRVLTALVYSAPRALLVDERVNNVSAAAISVNGQDVLVGTGDGRLGVWNLESRQLTTLSEPLHDTTVTKITVSRGGTQIATSGANGSIILWNAATYLPIGPLASDASIINDLAFSPDGTQLATVRNFENIDLWDINQSGATLNTTLPRTSADNINSIAYSNDGSRLLVVAEDTVRIWRFAAQEYDTLTNAPIRNRRGVFSNDDRKIVLSGDTLTFAPEIWNVDTLTKAQSQGAQDANVNSVTFSPNNQLVLSASDDATAILSDAFNGRVIRRLVAHTSPVVSAFFTPDGNRIITAGLNGEIYLWDTANASGNIAQQFTGEGVSRVSVGSVNVLNDGAQVLAVRENAEFNVWNTDDGQVLLSRSLEQPQIPQVVNVLSPQSTDEQLLQFVGTTDVQLFNLNSGETLQRFTATQERAWVESLALTSDGQRLLWAGAFFFRRDSVDFTRGGLLTLWDVQSGQLIRMYRGDEENLPEGLNNAITAVVFAPNDNTFALGTETGLLQVLDTETGQLRAQFTGHTDTITSIEYSADGTRLLTASADRSIILWDVATQTQIRRFIGHINVIWSATFSPAETNVLSGSEDTSMILWDVATGQAIQQFGNLGAPITAVAFINDGTQAISGAQDGTVIVWNVQTTESILRWARENRYIPMLTCDQRLQFGVPSPDCAPSTPEATAEATAAADTTAEPTAEAAPVADTTADPAPTAEPTAQVTATP